MKSILIISLCALLVLEGCTSYYVLNEKERLQDRSPDDEAILVTLENGDEIEYEPGHYVEVTEPSDVLFGAGYGGKSINKEHIEFTGYRNGAIPRSVIDSSKDVIIHSDQYYRCWLSDGSVVWFKNGEYINITPDSGTGWWVLAKKNESGFITKIDMNGVQKIEVEVSKNDGLKTLLFALGITALIVGAFAASVAVSYSFSMN